MIFPIAIFATSLCLLFLLIVPQAGVLATIALKPIIDASWNSSFGGINCLQILGVFVPLLLLPRILFSRENGGIFSKACVFIGIVYLLLNCFGLISMIGHGNFLSSTEIFLRVLNGFLGFLMIQHYVNDRKSFGILLIALLVAGLFPMLFGLYQELTGKVWQLRATSYGQLARNVGLYHDAFSIRAYGFQTITAILLSWTYFTVGSHWKKFGLLFYGVVCCFVIFKSYSKAAIVIFIAWVVIWSIFNRKFYWLLIIPVILFVLNLATGNRLVENIETLFIKEIGTVSGTIDEKYVLSGRTIVWQEAIEEWEHLPWFKQLLGSGENLPVHNEFLRHLIANGIIGLSLYLLVVLAIGWKTSLNVVRHNSALSVMGLMVFIMWFIDNLGLHPGLYPAYQWYIFGFITLAIRGVDGLDVDSEPVIQAAYPSYGSVYADKDC